MISKITIPTPFAVGDVHCYILRGDVLSIVDVGPRTEEALQVLKASLSDLNIRFEDIEQIILTHHHPDHSGLVDVFPNAKILGHPYNRAWLQRDESFFSNHDEFYLARLKEEGVPECYFHWLDRMKRPVQFMGTKPLDEELHHLQQLPGHPGWIIYETLGHAQSHLSFYHAETETYIGGDLLLERISSNPLIEPPFNKFDARPRSMLQYNASLKSMLQIPIKIVHPGHGNDVLNAHTLINERLVRQHNRAMGVHDMLQGKALSTFDVTKVLFAKIYEKQLGLTLSETIGQLDYLVDRGFIKESLTHSGVILYEQT